MEIKTNYTPCQFIVMGNIMRIVYYFIISKTAQNKSPWMLQILENNSIHTGVSKK